MLDGSTFIKLFRGLLDWRWYKNGNTMRVFIHLLLKANISDGEIENITIKRGQVVTSRKHLSSELNISEQEVRTALEHLKATSEITTRSTSKFTIITIVNWDKYQSPTNKTTSEQPANNQQSTSDQPQYEKGNKNFNNYKNEREGTLSPLGRFKNVLLTQGELDELKKAYPKDYQAKIERLSRYLENTGRKYKNHFSTLLDWLEQDAKPQQRNASYELDEIAKIADPPKYIKGVDYF